MSCTERPHTKGVRAMDQPRFAAWTRRRFLTRAAGLAASATFVPSGSVLHHNGWVVSASETAAPNAVFHPPLAPSAPLIDGIAAVCRRLAPEGWRNLLLAVSHAEL